MRRLWGRVLPYAKSFHFWVERRAESAFEADHREDMKDPEYAEQFQQSLEEMRSGQLIKARTEDEELNDPFDIWGPKPSYRCYVARHKDCETEGADKGCTCACGHQEPVCACGLYDDIKDGIVSFFMHQHESGCPMWRPPQWADVRGPKTWCSHPAEFHGPEAGCIECPCIATTGHRRRAG